MDEELKTNADISNAKTMLTATIPIFVMTNGYEEQSGHLMIYNVITPNTASKYK